jgi:hypothetical protein
MGVTKQIYNMGVTTWGGNMGIAIWAYNMGFEIWGLQDRFTTCTGITTWGLPALYSMSFLIAST